MFEKLVDIFLAKQSDSVDTSLFGCPQGKISVPQHKTIVPGFSGHLSSIEIRWINDVQLAREFVGQLSQFRYAQAIIEMAASHEISDKSFFLFTIENHLCCRMRSNAANDYQQLDIRFF